MSTRLKNIVTTFYALQSMFSHLIDAGLIMPERDIDGSFMGFVPNPGSDAENYNVRQMASVVRFLHYREDFTSSVADRYFVYLWYACMGEARHASDMTHNGEFPAGIRQDCSRERACENAVNYSPMITRNREMLESVFRDLYWGGSFGGDAWADIVKAMNLYFVDKTTFIDLVHDLEHNGGTIFNKTSAAYAVGLELQESSLRSLLDVKRDNDILTLPSWSQYVFPDAASVVNPLMRLLGLERVNSNVYNDSEWYELPEFGESMLDDEGWREAEPEYTCHECGDGLSEDEASFVNGNPYCESCASDVTFTCEQCDETTHNDDMSEVEYVCSSCYYKNYSQCEKCGDTVHNDDLHYVHTPDDEEYCETLLCESCEEDITTCDICNKSMWFTTITLPHMKGDVIACDECGEVLKAQGYNELQMTFKELEYV